MLGYCAAWDQVAFERCMRALGVSSEFLLEFPVGWIPELGCMAIGTMDAHERLVGIGVVPASIPAGMVVDVSALHGSVGFPALPLSPALRGVLLVDSDWKRLEAHWRAGGSIAWRSSDVTDERAYASIVTFPPETVPSRILVSGAFQEVRSCQASDSRRRRSSTS